jgi:AGZA family xanthine/uracil permease-like MFS transporter
MRRELLAGLSTFFTIAYYFLLFPKILSEGGIDFGAALTGTIVTLVLSTLFLAFYANFPAVLAPGIAVGAYLIYSVILPQHATWQQALGLVFWSGLAIFLLSLFKVRQKILLHLPPSLAAAAIGGIGLFLICVGLKDLSILIPDPVLFYRFGPLVTLPNGIALFGLILFFLLHYFRISSAFLVSILASWAAALAFGLAPWKGFAAPPPSPLPSLLQLDLLGSLHPSLWGILVSVILISLFDSTASLTALAKLAHATDEKGRIKNIDRIVIPDGVGTMLSACFGATNLSFFLESSSGIKAGGRTGATASVAALCSLVCLFLYPLVSSIPLFASTPALIAIGVFMARISKEIAWRDWTEAIPALLTLLTIPLTFSIYKGFAFGFIAYIFLKTLSGRWKQIHWISWILGLIFFSHLCWSLATGHF